MTGARSVRTIVNFVEDRPGQKFSNFDPSRWDMRLVPMEADLIDMRRLDPAPELMREGFTLAGHPVSGNWRDQAWIDAVYVPSCIDLVKRLSGAEQAIQIFFPLIRSSGETQPGIAATAHFLHMDIPREEYFGFARICAEPAGIDLEGANAAIFNVWKAISPPPQSMPLALYPRGAIADADHVICTNDEDEYRSHFVCARPPEQATAMFYAPDMTIDESLVFIGADFRPGEPLGVAHQAVVPGAGSTQAPRTSIEVRVLALF